MCLNDNRTKLMPSIVMHICKTTLPQTHSKTLQKSIPSNTRTELHDLLTWAKIKWAFVGY